MSEGKKQEKGKEHGRDTKRKIVLTILNTSRDGGRKKL